MDPIQSLSQAAMAISILELELDISIEIFKLFLDRIVDLDFLLLCMDS